MKITKDAVIAWEVFGVLIFLFGATASWYVGHEWYISAMLLTGAGIYIVCLAIMTYNWWVNRKMSRGLYHNERDDGGKK
jgi:type VI protein secretion system component VasK